MPASIPADALVGQWGLAAYHQEAARARTEKAAKAQCNKPYVITKGPNGGVIMHLADNPTPQELVLKGGPGGKNYVGPPGEIGISDREIIFSDNQMMILQWMDPEIVGRYGTMIYVRCRR
jgi:hypothetical protein